MSEKLSFPPLCYALIQVVFNQILKMENFIPDIQDRIRQLGYPDFSSEQRNNIVIDDAGVQPPKFEVDNIWSFNDSARQNGYVLSKSLLVYHTTNYKTYEIFEQEMLKGFKLLHDIVGLNFIQRVGMRYINIISPQKEEPISYYLRKEVLGMIEAEEEGFLSFDGVTAKRIENGLLLIRTSARPDAPPFLLPGDLMPLKLSPPDNAFAKKTMTRALLDLDYYTEERFDLDIAMLQKKVKFAHEQIENAFHQAVTNEAMDKWR